MSLSWNGKNWQIAQSHALALSDLKDRNSKSEMVYDAFDLPDVSTAVERIKKSIDAQEKIMVFGDFDTDGITSTVILVHALEQLGACISYRIPERATDSHGLKTHLIDEIAQTKTDLIITCDCGTNDKFEVSYAQSLGMEVIITDHHEVRTEVFPESAVAVVNPKRPDSCYQNANLSGSMVAYKLIEAYITRYPPQSSIDPCEFLQPYLELATIGLVADCMPLVGENFILVKQGIKLLQKTQWPALQNLLTRFGIQGAMISEETIGFIIAPHLNAASRLGDVRQAVQIFLGDRQRMSARIEYLVNLNLERKCQTEQAQLEAQTQLRADRSFQLIRSKNWGVGILGLVAGRLCEQLGQPVIAVREEADGSLKASCRSTESVSMIQILEAMPDCFTVFGGHMGAAGFQSHVDKWKILEQQLETYFKSKVIAPSKLLVKGILPESLLQLEVLDLLREYGPYGVGHSLPQFLLPYIEVLEFKVMGSQKNHLDLLCLYEGKPLRVVGFFMNQILQKVVIGACLDLVVKLGDNYWQGRRSLQVLLVDAKEACIEDRGSA